MSISCCQISGIKIRISTSLSIRQRFVVNRTCHSINARSLEILSKVPLKEFFVYLKILQTPEMRNTTNSILDVFMFLNAHLRERFEPSVSKEIFEW